MADMTERAERIAKIEARANAATEGPWTACGVEPTDRPSVNPEHNIAQPRKHKNGACSCGFVWSTPVDSPVLEVIGGRWGDTWPSIRRREDGTLEPYIEACYYGEVPREAQAENMKFIAHARADIPWLLEQLRAAQAEMERAQEWSGKLANTITEMHASGVSLRAKLATAREALAEIVVPPQADGSSLYYIETEDMQRAAAALAELDKP